MEEIEEIEEMESEGNKYPFSIKTHSRTYFLYSTDDEDRKLWIKCTRECMPQTQFSSVSEVEEQIEGEDKFLCQEEYTTANFVQSSL